MKKYFIIIGCVSALAFTLTAGESRFELVQKIGGNTIEIRDRPATVIFVGDIMLGRNVENLMNINDAEYPFEEIKDFLKDSDGVVANLEGPIVNLHTRTVSNSLRFSFASSTAPLLALNNVVAVSLANNHAYDQGVSGFSETKRYLEKNKISSAGTPYEVGAASVARRTIGGFPFVFAAFNFTHPGFDAAKALNLVKKIERRPEDFVVAMVHGGEEYATSSNAAQQKFYRSLIDVGADVVIAHHPHVVQEIEEYKNKPIFYSLGNFIFDQYFSPEVEEGLAIKLTLSEREAKYEIIPISGNHSQPKLSATSSPNKIIVVSRKFLNNVQ